MTPDKTFRVRAGDYEHALATEGEKWLDSTTAQPVWQGTSAYRLLKGTADKTFWRLFAIAADCDSQLLEQSSTTAAVAGVVCGAAFRSPRDMETVALARLVEQMGRALTCYEHARVIDATRELWAIACPRTVDVFELTAAGRAALAATPNAERVA